MQSYMALALMYLYNGNTLDLVTAIVNPLAVR